MRLKKIEMNGFKSFADRTVIRFDAGITGIVGPNGCGKSNVSDAFRWVLGEQSAKSMRGGKMGDVIFAGSGRRKGSPFAEVILVFTEVGDALPIEYEEVSVGRRLYRNGDSEYRLNGNLVRLRDIHSLFWDTGLGKDSLAIFEQGKIEEVIVRSPLDRRPIFESAAGILRFRIRRKEAKQKLDKMDGNLSRVEDLLGEVDRQMEQLERQVAEAKEYRSNKTKLELLEKGVMRAKITRAREAVAREEGRREKLETRLSNAKEKVLAREKGVATAQGSLKEFEEQFRGSQEALFRARGELEVLRVEREAVQQRIGELDGRLAKWREELTLLDQQKKELLGDRPDPSAGLEAKVKEAEALYRASSKSAEELEQSVHESRAMQKQAEEQKMESVRREHAVASQLRELQVRLETGAEQLEKMQSRSETLEARFAEMKGLLKEKSERVEAASSRVDTLKASAQALEKELATRNERLVELRQQRESRSVASTEMRAREKALLRLKEEMEGFSPGAKRLLQEVKGLKPLCEQIRPKKGRVAATAALLQPYAHTLFAKDLKALEEVRAFAKEQGITGFSITAPELVGEKGAKLVDVELVDAIELAEGPRVTAAGEYLDARGVLFMPGSSESSSLLREAEIGELQEKLAASEKEEQRDAVEQEGLEKEVAALEKELREKDLAHRQEEMKLVEVNFSLQRAKGDLEGIEKERGESQSSYEELAKGRAELSLSVKKLTKQQSEVAKGLVAAQELCGKVDCELEERLEALQAHRTGLQKCEANYRQLAEQLHQQTTHQRLVEAKLQAIDRQRTKGEQEISQAEKQRAELAGQSVLRAKEGPLTGYEDRCKRFDEKVTAAREKLEKGREQLRAVQEELQRLAMEREQVDDRVASGKRTVEAAAQEAVERFELTAIQLEQMELPKIESIGESEREIHQLRRKMEAASNVNLGAVEEYEKYKERSDFLSAQVGDLQGSKRELLQVIGQLEKTSRKQFRETFETVRSNFKRTFQLLFEGGEADLKFTESTDILEAGIEIVAQPPGKQMRSISLLSGGEKCLTALALLFAIFEVNPSPVCILDETDAPLDDTNVGRFLRVLGSFLETTQFIMITHNKKTMEAAGVLIGVTMQEKGVSKPIEMRMSEVSEEMTVGV